VKFCNLAKKRLLQISTSFEKQIANARKKKNLEKLPDFYAMHGSSR
jgi:hypothetical protein